MDAMNSPTEADDQVRQTEPTSSSPLDLSTKKRKRSDSEAEAEANDGGPEAEQTAEDDRDAASSAGEDVKLTPLDLSRDGAASAATGTGDGRNALRPSVVVRSPTAAVAVTSPPPPKVYRGAAAAEPPPVADDHAPLPSTKDRSSSPPKRSAPADSSYERWLAAADYHSFLTAAATAAKPPLPLIPLARPLQEPPAAQYQHHLHQQQHQHQQQLYLQQQQQLHMHQQQQLQLQIQLQQQQLAAYGSHRHPFDLNPLMMMPAHDVASPLYVATSSPSSSESNQFPFCGFDYLPKSAYSFRYPYFDEILDKKGARDYGDGGRLDSRSGGGRSDCLSPESTTPVERHRRVAKMLDDPDVDPEEIAAIYRQSDFVSFRNRYLESLGPPKNFEKMRRSVPNKKPQMNGQQSYDQTYVMKRQKNNEAAKRSRDAKRQKYIENQISVMYLTKKVSEMKEIKRRLLMSM